jgi:acyl-CoA thioesterase-1
VAGQSALNQPDGIHPNVEGARIVAETVWTVLRPVLDQILASS